MPPAVPLPPDPPGAARAAPTELRRLARQAVSNALRAGTLTRRPCEQCGKEPAEAHHPDYSRPLAVLWLCGDHHDAVHGAVVASRCLACGHGLTGRQRTACSGKCRAELSRQGRAQAQADRDAEVRRHAEAIIRLLDGRGTR